MTCRVVAEKRVHSVVIEPIPLFSFTADADIANRAMVCIYARRTGSRLVLPSTGMILALLGLAASPTCARRGGAFYPSNTRHLRAAFAFQDENFLWALRATSALTSYFGLVGYLDRPQGKLMDKADACLDVKQSTVPNAGLGLFAKVSLPKDTVLGTYPGRVIPLRQNLDKLAKYPQCEAYVWRFSDNQYVIDPTNTHGILDDMCRGGNPSMPLSVQWHEILNLQTPTTLCRINEPPLGKDVNVVIEEDCDNRRVVLALERDVLAGEEFFLDYGLSYDRSRYGGDNE